LRSGKRPIILKSLGCNRNWPLISCQIHLIKFKVQTKHFQSRNLSFFILFFKVFFSHKGTLKWVLLLGQRLPEGARAQTIEIGYIEGESIIKINFWLMYRFTNSWPTKAAGIQLLVNQNLQRCKFFQLLRQRCVVYIFDVYGSNPQTSDSQPDAKTNESQQPFHILYLSKFKKVCIRHCKKVPLINCYKLKKNHGILLFEYLQNILQPFKNSSFEN